MKSCLVKEHNETNNGIWIKLQWIHDADEKHFHVLERQAWNQDVAIFMSVKLWDREWFVKVAGEEEEEEGTMFICT